MYSCPGCGANITYNIKAQKMKCEHCGAEADPYSYDNITDAESFTVMDMVVYSCPQCGGEIACDQNEAAAFCSYCGASTILNGRIEKMKRPKFIIPFKRTKEDCVEIYRKKMRNAHFAPVDIRNVRNIDSFRGIYMPFWLYSFKKNDNVNIKGTKSYRRGDYIITEHYSISSLVDFDYAGVAFDAASSFSDDISQVIVPYDTKETIFFTPAIFSGFYADSFDVPSEIYIDDAMKAVSEETVKLFTEDSALRGLSIDKAGAQTQFASQCYETNLAAFPVWFMSYRMKVKKQDRIAYMAVNGQTGKLMADIPISIKKYVAAVVILAVVLSLVSNLFFAPQPHVALIITLIISVITRIMAATQNTAIAKKEIGLDDKGKALINKPDKAFLKNYKKYDSKIVFVLNIILWIVGLLVCIVTTTDDLFYYVPTALLSAASFANLMILISNYNMLTTRPLPQFNRKGGDDSVSFN